MTRKKDPLFKKGDYVKLVTAMRNCVLKISFPFWSNDLNCYVYAVSGLPYNFLECQLEKVDSFDYQILEGIENDPDELFNIFYILEKWIDIEETGDDLIPYHFREKKQYVSNSSSDVISEEEYRLIKHCLFSAERRR